MSSYKGIASHFADAILTPHVCSYPRSPVVLFWHPMDSLLRSMNYLSICTGSDGADI